MKAKHLLLSLSLCAVFSISFAETKTTYPNTYQLGTCVAKTMIYASGYTTDMTTYYKIASCYNGNSWVLKNNMDTTYTTTPPPVDCENSSKHPTTKPSSLGKACSTARNYCRTTAYDGSTKGNLGATWSPSSLCN
jgi:ubiquitin-protein ligase